LSITFPLILIILSFVFKKRQNKGDIVGGDISTPKSLWLCFAIGAWFFYPFFYFLTPLESSLFHILFFHLISIWVRGLLELVMIYKWYNWSPRYGIAHNTFHFLGVFILSLFYYDKVASNFSFATFIILVLVSFLFETLFAILFFKVRGEEKHKVYFASDDPKWRFINRLTITANFICYGLLFSAGYFLDI
jgi:hypothetical protein